MATARASSSHPGGPHPGSRWREVTGVPARARARRCAGPLLIGRAGVPATVGQPTLWKTTSPLISTYLSLEWTVKYIVPLSFRSLAMMSLVSLLDSRAQ